MSTVNLLPDADVSNSPAWTIGTGSDVYAMLDDDDSGHVGSDSSDIEATSSGPDCIVTMQDSGLSDVTINSVTLVFKHNNRDRGQTYTIGTEIRSPSGIYYAENTGTQSPSASWRTSTMTTRTTSDGSNAWTIAQIDAIRLGLVLAAISGGTVGITYAYFIVDYTLLAADNAVFFGSNF